MTRWRDLFTPRQLVALTTFSALVQEAREQVKQDAVAVGFANDGKPLHESGTGADAYAQAIAIYLALAVSKMANRANTLATWMPDVQCPGHLFKRHALPMSWDYSEGNSVSGPSGSFESMLENTADGLRFVSGNSVAGHAVQANASDQSLRIVDLTTFPFRGVDS
jgi:putative DNA methylase